MNLTSGPKPKLQMATNIRYRGKRQKDSQTTKSTRFHIGQADCEDEEGASLPLGCFSFYFFFHHPFQLTVRAKSEDPGGLGSTFGELDMTVVFLSLAWLAVELPWFFSAEDPTSTSSLNGSEAGDSDAASAPSLGIRHVLCKLAPPELPGLMCT